METFATSRHTKAANSKLSQQQVTILVKLSLLFVLLFQILPLPALGLLGDEQNSLVYDTRSLYKPHQLARPKRSASSATSAGQFVDACQSKVEVITPYYARNSKGKLRTIVNSEQMQQAIQIESCVG